MDRKIKKEESSCENKNEYVEEKILDQRRVKGMRTWEPERNLGCDELIRTFEEARKEKENEEESLFSARAYLCRYDENKRQWKERGFGEMMVLYDPIRKTYRLLLRREQVHKAVLNMPIFMNLELLPTKKCSRAWILRGKNFAENSEGAQETLAVSFKKVFLATEFKDTVDECTRKLQAAAPETTIKEEKEPEESSTRVDVNILASVPELTQTAPIAQSSIGQVPSRTDASKGTAEVFKQVKEEPTSDKDEDDEEHGHNEDFDEYYNDETLFSGRASLYRYDETPTTSTRQWKERGVGELMVLYDPVRKTYRLLLRREQVHKPVLNMLIFKHLELLPMNKSSRAWTWAGLNFAENTEGAKETLAVRFKEVYLANEFKNTVDECTRKLQAAATATASKVEKVPKKLESRSRVDVNIWASVPELTQTAPIAQSSISQVPSGTDASKGTAEVFKQVKEEPTSDKDEDDEEHDHNEDYDEYYNDVHEEPTSNQDEEDEDDEEYYTDEEEEEVEEAFYECIGEVVVRAGHQVEQCEHAHVKVLFDQELYWPKVLISDRNTRETLFGTLIYTDTEFQMRGHSCTWTETDFMPDDLVEKTFTVNFADSETAKQFYDSCEASKGALNSSTEGDLEAN